VSANKNFVCGALCVFLFGIAGAAALPANPSAPREDALLDGITALANEVLAIRDVRGPLRIDWHNDSSLSPDQSAPLQREFSARLSAIRGLLTEDAAAPPLRIFLRDTPTQLLAIARVPAGEGEQVRIVQLSRTAFSAQDLPPPTPFLRKQLLWRQREPVLDAAERPVGAANLLVVLGRETLWTYDSSRDPVQLQAVTRIPGAVHFSRSLNARLRFSREDDLHFTAELPGKTCSGNIADRIVFECIPADQRFSNSKRSPSAPSNLAELTAPCDLTRWTLSSDEGDWSKPDHLFLHNNRNTAAGRIAALDLPGPLLTLDISPQGLSTVAVVLNLTTGEYDIYRLALACHD
jgi:hypothetical protein